MWLLYGWKIAARGNAGGYPWARGARPVRVGKCQNFFPVPIFVGILTALSAILLRARAQKPGLSFFKVVLIGRRRGLSHPPDRCLPGGGMAEPVVAAGSARRHNRGRCFSGLGWHLPFFSSVNARASRRACRSGPGYWPAVAMAVLLPPLIDWATGSYQRTSLRTDVNHCTQGMRGQAQPNQVTNICDEPITVGLCMPGEINPAPCAQSYTIEPGQTARFDPGEASLSSLPGNPGGLTVVACSPPDRPSRMVAVHGRGYEGVCIPPA